jgi:SAM-dependent methyltransferase
MAGLTPWPHRSVHGAWIGPAPIRYDPWPLLARQSMDPSSTSREARYFDRLVAEQGDFDPFTARGWATLRRRFERVTPPLAGARLLDVGCGTGRSRQIYEGRFASYVGVDLSLVALRVASSRRRGEYVQADACRLPFPDASFDLVVWSSVLHHIPDRRAALVEGHRVLRPGGRTFAYDPNLLHPAMALFRHPRSPLYNPEGVSPDEAPLLPRALRRDFLAAGFVTVGQRGQSDLPYRSVAPRRLDALLALYNRADWLWERLGFGRTFGTFVISWGARP